MVMGVVDYLVLIGYFAVLIAIGYWSSRKIKKQVDFFMGGRSFGKLLQTFAAFGAGTGSADPVNTARTAFVNGLSGMWSVMYWLFVTPFYWITGVWYRRMRHLTLGDWFVERYQSQAMGLGYCLFGLGFFVVYGSMLFTAIGDVAAPLVGIRAVQIGGATIDIEVILVPLIGLIVMAYGVMGGLEAAYFTDLIQGLCIILLSILLIPFGLQTLVQTFGDPETQSLWDGFRIMHEQLPDHYFTVVGATSTAEFPWYRILAIVWINLVGIVIQPHFIATGGGSARTEMNARVGLVTGNFLKRFCTIGWVLTTLIVVALYGSLPELNADPAKAWGHASANLLPVGLRGLMLACLLAALMSSADAYMVIGSALVVRNIYAPYINRNATESEYIRVGRITGCVVIAGAVLLSLTISDVFKQLELTWVFGVLFAAPFWIGMYWRRATTGAAWGTVTFNVLFIFLIPIFLPVLWPGLREIPELHLKNEQKVVVTTRAITPVDVEIRSRWQESFDKAVAGAEIDWDLLRQISVPKIYRRAESEKYRQWAARFAQAVKKADREGIAPPPDRQIWEDLSKRIAGVDRREAKRILAAEGGEIEKRETTGGKAIFWSHGITSVKRNGRTVEIGKGNFEIDFLLYRMVGVPLEYLTNAQLATLALPTKIVIPFLVMILLSWLTPPNDKQALDRYYAKMKTPVVPDPELDRKNLEAALDDPQSLERKKLFPGTNLEIQKPTWVDIVGFVFSFALCFAIIALAVWVTNLGG